MRTVFEFYILGFPILLVALILILYFRSKAGRREREAKRDKTLNEIMALKISDYERLKTQLEIVLQDIHDWDARLTRFFNTATFMLVVLAVGIAMTAAFVIGAK